MPLSSERTLPECRPGSWRSWHVRAAPGSSAGRPRPPAGASRTSAAAHADAPGRARAPAPARAGSRSAAAAARRRSAAGALTWTETTGSVGAGPGPTCPGRRAAAAPGTRARVGPARGSARAPPARAHRPAPAGSSRPCPQPGRISRSKSIASRSSVTSSSARSPDEYASSNIARSRCSSGVTAGIRSSSVPISSGLQHPRELLRALGGGNQVGRVVLALAGLHLDAQQRPGCGELTGNARRQPGHAPTGSRCSDEARVRRSSPDRGRARSPSQRAGRRRRRRRDRSCRPPRGEQDRPAGRSAHDPRLASGCQSPQDEKFAADAKPPAPGPGPGRAFLRRRSERSSRSACTDRRLRPRRPASRRTPGSAGNRTTPA